MPRRLGGVVWLCTCATVSAAVLAVPARAQHVWSGLSYTFAKEDFANPELEENQDRITSTVWFTRDDIFGLLNAVSDRFNGQLIYTPNSSPDQTRWATGAMPANIGKTISAANYADLTFTSWQQSYGGMSQLATNILVHRAVVHLLAEDIYLDIQFTSWTVASGGGFTYVRSVLPGDFNGDGRVDGGDYVHWRNRLGDDVDNPGDGDDLDQSGVIDIGDYLEWKQRYGDSVPPPLEGEGLGLATPEPAGILLGIVGAVTLQMTLGRRRALTT